MSFPDWQGESRLLSERDRFHRFTFRNESNRLGVDSADPSDFSNSNFDNALPDVVTGDHSASPFSTHRKSTMLMSSPCSQRRDVSVPMWRRRFATVRNQFEMIEKGAFSRNQIPSRVAESQRTAAPCCFQHRSSNNFKRVLSPKTLQHPVQRSAQERSPL
jgi:hypothetical protein